MSVAIKLGTDLVWGTKGTGGAGTSTLGKILSCSSKSGGKEFEQEDEDGQTYSLILYDDREEITLEVLAAAAAVKPARGSLATIAGVTDAIVIDSEVKWQAGQTKKIAVSLRKYT